MNLNPTIRITVAPAVAAQLDHFYRKKGVPRHFRRVAGARKQPDQAQTLITTQFIVDVIALHAKPHESLEQTIYRLAGGFAR